MRKLFSLVLTAALYPACTVPLMPDSGAGADAPALLDAEPTDAQPTDAQPTDAQPTDAQPTDAGPSDGGTTDSPDVPRPSETRVYVLSMLHVPSPMDGSSPGIDLDDRRSTGGAACEDAMDFVSPLTMTPGVDNQFGANLGRFVDLDTALDARFAAGRDLLALSVEGIDSYEDDAVVTLRVQRVVVAGGTAPLLTMGRLAPGQRFTVVTDIGTASARIEGGRLVGSFSAYSLDLTLGVAMVPVRLEDVRFNARISPTSLTDGELGAHITMPDLLEAVSAIMPTTEAALRSLARPDLMADAMAGNCGAISFAGTIEAVEGSL